METVPEGKREEKAFLESIPEEDAWKPTLPVPPGKGEEKMDKEEEKTISGTGMRKTKSEVVEGGSDEDESSEDGSNEGLSTLDKALLASDAARLANAVRKIANKKKMDDVASASDNIPTGKRKKMLNKAGDAAKKF